MAMKTSFILLTRLVSEEVHPALSIGEKARAVKEQVRAQCPGVEWKSSYATLGPWNYIDVFEAPDTETALKVAALVRYYGGARAEVWPVVAWDDYKRVLRDLDDAIAA
jgi:uncharacterized protein with GYD domain